MPFCRECGKVVEEDWVTCPFCIHSIGPPASNSSSPNIQDSVIMGDVNAGNELICPHCSSIGSVLIACVNCREISYCSTCEPEIKTKRHLERFDLHGMWVFGEEFAYGITTAGWDSISSKRCCDDCWNKWLEKIQFSLAEELYNWLDIDLMEFDKKYQRLGLNLDNIQVENAMKELERLGWTGWTWPTLDSINE